MGIGQKGKNKTEKKIIRIDKPKNKDRERQRTTKKEGEELRKIEEEKKR